MVLMEPVIICFSSLRVVGVGGGGGGGWGGAEITFLPKEILIQYQVNPFFALPGHKHEMFHNMNFIVAETGH